MKKLRHILSGPHAWLLCAVVLYLFSFLFNDSFSIKGSVTRERRALESYIHKEESKFEDRVNDTALMKRLANRAESFDELTEIISEKTGLFIFRKSSSYSITLAFWSHQHSFPLDETVHWPNGEYFRPMENGYYISVRRSISDNDDSLIVIGMIPILNLFDYTVNERSISSQFVYSKSAISKIAISDTATADSVSVASGKKLFCLSPVNRLINADDGGLASFLKVMAVLLLLVYIHLLAERTEKKFGFWQGLGVLAGTFLVLRVISYFVPFPLNLRQFSLFDPNIYASTDIHKSLGDLLINASLFCWIVLFAGKRLDSKVDYSLPQGNKRWIMGGASIVGIVLFTFFVAFTVRSLAADSKISFDVINFFSLTTFTIFGFVALALLAVGYYYFMRIMVPFVATVFRMNVYIVYLVIAVTGLTFLTFQIDNPLLPFYVIVLAWLVAYTWLLRTEKLTVNASRQSMAGALFWIFIFSLSITAIIIDANRQKEWEQRKRRAIKIDRLTDPNETQLNISLIGLDERFLTSNFHRFTEAASSAYLRDSILRKSKYLSEIYETRLYVYDANKKPLFNDEPESYNNLDAILQVQAKATRVEHLSYYEVSFGKYIFIYKRDVVDLAGKPLGSLFLVSDPEKYIRTLGYPELFKRSGQANTEEALGYSYGIYKNGILLTQPFNKYSFATTLTPSEMSRERFSRVRRGQYDELWYKAMAFNEKIIVIVRKKETLLEAITLFSYIFCVFLFLVAAFNALVLVLRVGGNIREFRRLMEWDIRTQIHSTIIFISIFSFIIIAVATISFFIRRYAQNNEDRLSRTMEIVVKEMEKKLDERRAVDDQLAIYDSVENKAVVNLVNDVAEIHDVDVNVYDTAGYLHVTSQPLVYRGGILSKYMDPLAFYHLNRLNEVQRVQQESFSSISYLSIYSPLRGRDNGIAYAYINIPYFSSQSGLKQEISNFLVAVINLNAFIFLIAGVIALFITNRVTRSFSFISEKMREVNLGRNNEEIEWKRNDEIGGLVKEYNKMVKKLEVSAAALARSEREGAWREMARQVAHEIKNPLTPMKLSIQYLQKSIDNNSGNVKELTANVAKTLVEQIDHLSKIAFDFSQFANIGNTNIETFDINDVIRSLDNLYKTNDDVDLTMNLSYEKVMVKADKTQMNRLFTNLLQNAIEACDGKEGCNIELSEERENGIVRISVKDDGAGIPADMQAKIFIPNFTTKSSGTGLGLAMCKGIVEQAGGKIWFETKMKEGSTFYVELPVIN